MSAPASTPPLTPRDLTSGTDVRWCPGCGDYSILAQLKKTLAGLGIPRERLAFVSGVGCSGRLPYYLHAYGFHAVHGPPPAVPTGLKLVRPELSVWASTSDGYGLSLGGHPSMHALRGHARSETLLVN